MRRTPTRPDQLAAHAPAPLPARMSALSALPELTRIAENMALPAPLRPVRSHATAGAHIPKQAA